MSTYLDRYLAGEHEAVWRELTALGPAVRQAPLYADALAVARETMRRVRENILELQARLESVSYRFGYGGLRPDICFFCEDRQDAPLRFLDPDPDIAASLHTLEDWQGPIPLSLQAWYEQVGAVNFVGMAPHLPLSVPFPHAALMSDIVRHKRAGQRGKPDPALVADYDIDINSPTRATVVLLSDPLWIYPFPSLAAITELRDDWRRPLSYLELAPDYVFKHEGAGGGGAYMVKLPNADVDAIVQAEGLDIRFVEYLRLSLEWAGFPGMRLWPRPPRAAIQALAEGLQPF